MVPYSQWSESTKALVLIFSFIYISIYHYVKIKNYTSIFVRDVGIIEKDYPQKYCVVSPFIRRQFRIGPRKIRKYAYRNYIFADIVGSLWVLNTLIFLLSKANMIVGNLLLAFQLLMLIGEQLVFLSYYIYYRCRKKRELKQENQNRKKGKKQR